MSRYPNLDPDQAMAAPDLAALRDMLHAAPVTQPSGGVWAAMLERALDPGANDRDDEPGHPAPAHADLAHGASAPGTPDSHPAGAGGHVPGPGQHPEPWRVPHPGGLPGEHLNHTDHTADDPHLEGGHWL